MNKLLTTLAATITVGATALAVSTTLTTPSDISPAGERTREERVALRESRPRKAVAEVPRIKGGIDSSKPLYGMIYTAYDGPFYGYQGPLEIHADGSHVKVSGSTSISVMSGCYMDGKFFSVGYSGSEKLLHYMVHDTESWAEESHVRYMFPATGLLPLDLTYDPETKRIYGCFVGDASKYLSGKEANFGWINFDDIGEPVITVADMGVRMRGIAANKDGVIYGIGFDNGLYTINKYNASLTKIATLTWDKRHGGKPDQPWNYGYESAEIDWETGEIYFSFNDSEEDSFIVRIDPNDGKMEYVADFGYWSHGTGMAEEFSAIYFKQNTEAASGTPKQVENLKATAKGTDLAATLDFTMPELDTDENELSGQLKWTVSVGEAELKTGTANPGEHITTEVATTEDGFHNFAVVASNGTLKGTPVYSRIYVGNDYPDLWLQPTAFADGCDVTVTWRAANALNNGNLSPITYRVVRQPDGVTVAESTERNFITDKVPSLIKAAYTYDVTPISGPKEGAMKSTRPIYAGEIFDLPHVNDFTDELLFNQYPVIDNNKDNNTWWIDSSKRYAVYSGSTTVDADDYLCIGPFQMIGGSIYTISFTASAHSVDRFGVYVGTDPEDVKTFATEISAPRPVNASTGSQFVESKFTPAESGRYYFAIKACSTKSTSSLYIKDLKINGVTAKMPTVPKVEYTPTATGSILDITVPTANFDGSTPAGVTALKIYRDNVLMATITDKVSDGAKVRYTDNEQATRGEHIYSVTAVNKSGEGESCTVRAFLGLDQPGRPTNLRVYEDSKTSGLIHLTWDAPARGANGGYINPAELSYNIKWVSYGVAGSGEKSVGAVNSFDYQINGNITDQDIIAFTVKAQNSMGSTSSKSSRTHSTYFGPAYRLPLFESWTGNKTTSGIWSGEAVMDDANVFESWWEYGPATSSGILSGVMSQDLDGNMLMISTTRESGGCHRMRSPRVTLEGTTNPTLIFYLVHTDAAESFRVEIAVEDQPMTLLTEVELPAAEQKKWRRIEIPLNDYKSASYVQFGFVGVASRAVEQFAAIDNVNIIDNVDADLMVTQITAPTTAEYNQLISVDATIRNNSANPVERGAYSIRLIKNDVVVDEIPGPRIEAFKNITIPMEDKPIPTDPENTVYKVEIVFDADKAPSNNMSELCAVTIKTSIYPTPRNLKAASDNGVRLSWEVPDMSLLQGEKVTETFDKYEAFITSNIGSWTTYDGDKANTVVVATQLGPLNYPHIGEPMAWQVIDPEKANFLDGAWYARSGKQMLVSFQAVAPNTRDIQSDDWLISPELNGGAQHISFFARAGMKAYSPELMDIYYSTTGKEVADFKKLASDIEVPYASDWIEYKYLLPEGTRYFAIVHKSQNKLALLVDDITYSPVGSKQEDVSLLGYRVYRDGKCLNSRLIEKTSFNDIDTETGKRYKYYVTAVWDKAESGLSNPADCEAAIVTGIESVGGESTAIIITTAHLTIKVNGAPAGESVTVYNLTGIPVATVTAEAATTTIPVAVPGIYVVNVCGEAVKVAVR